MNHASTLRLAGAWRAPCFALDIVIEALLQNLLAQIDSCMVDAFGLLRLQHTGSCHTDGIGPHAGFSASKPAAKVQPSSATGESFV